MQWNNRSLVSSTGWPITSVTEQTNNEVFLKYRDLCNQHEKELESLATQHEHQIKHGEPLSRQPEWSKRKESLLNRLAKEAGLKDT